MTMQAASPENRILQQLRQGGLDQAWEMLGKRLGAGQLDSDLLRAFIDQALSMQRHDLLEAVQAELENRFPADSLAWRLLYHSWRQRTDWPRALAALERVGELEGWTDTLIIGRASLLEKMLKPEQALAELERVSADGGERPRAWLVRASAWQQQKDHDRILNELGAWLAATSLKEVVVARCWKLLGRTLDREGRYREAWQAFETGNRMERELHRPDLSRNPVRMRIEVFRSAFSAEAVAGWRQAPPAEETPAFLVGFPRSGTTLLEQVLDAHPGLQAMEEKPCLEQAWVYLYRIMMARAQAKGRFRPDRHWKDRHVAVTRELGELGEKEIREARRIYFEGVRGYIDREPGKMLVDKLPLNLVQVGFIRRLFPDAPVIVALRHPCDCILSGYMQGFEMNDAMENFLSVEDAAYLYRRVMVLLEQFEQLFAAQHEFHYIRYEDLLSDFRGQVSALLGYLGLDWDDAVEAYHQHARKRGTLGTPSYQGVTQALYDSARGRWRNYAEHLTPVFGHLQPACERFGYSLDSEASS